MENRSSGGKNGLEQNSEERIPKAQVGDQSGKNGCHRFEKKKTWEQLGCWSNWTWSELMRAWKKHPCQEGPWGLPHPGWKHQMMLRWGRISKKPTCSLSGLHLSITISSVWNTLPSHPYWASSYSTFRTQLNATSSEKQPLTTHSSCSWTSSCPWAFGHHSYSTECSMTCIYTPLPHKKKKKKKKTEKKIYFKTIKLQMEYIWQTIKVYCMSK